MKYFTTMAPATTRRGAQHWTVVVLFLSFLVAAAVSDNRHTEPIQACPSPQTLLGAILAEEAVGAAEQCHAIAAATAAASQRSREEALVFPHDDGPQNVRAATTEKQQPGAGADNHNHHNDDGSASPSSTPPWELRPSSPGRGLGIFATRPIPRGARIIVEPPLFAIAPPPPLPQHMGGGYSTAELARRVEAALAAVGPEGRAAHRACHDQHSSSSSSSAAVAAAAGHAGHAGSGKQRQRQSQRDKDLAIFRTNLYAIDGGRRWGMFPRAARVNHSCRPNAAHTWVVRVGEKEKGDDGGRTGRGGRMVVWALRDIEAGEEIEVSYVPLLKTGAERRAALRTLGFECGCSMCRREEEEKRKKSPVGDYDGDDDVRRRRMGELLDELSAGSRFGAGGPAVKTGYSYGSPAEKHADLLGRALELVRLLEEEDDGRGVGMADHLVTAYRFASELSLRLGDAASARAWAEKQLAILRFVDERSTDVRTVELFLENLGDESRDNWW